MTRDYTAGLNIKQRMEVARKLTKGHWLLELVGLPVERTEKQVRRAFEQVCGRLAYVDMTALESIGLRLSGADALFIERVPGQLVTYEVYIQNDADSIFSTGPNHRI